MPKDKGTIVFFSSNIEHEVTPVTKGTRYALVGWVNGPNLR
jgi:PKHD-type hydroxylase